MQRRPVVALLTDFGLCDPYVASMKGVIASIAPKTPVIDISHAVSPQNITQAAYLLWSCYKFFPPGTIFTCVVDPGVGTERNILCVEAAGYRFLAPDNGLLQMILDSTHARRIVRVENSRYFRQIVSPTFHGRDIFAPVAASLSNGLPVGRLGPGTTPRAKGEHLLEISSTRRRTYEGLILHIDQFGNIITNFRMRPGLTRPVTVRIGRRLVRKSARTYASAGKRSGFAVIGSTNLLEISVRSASAARLLRARLGQRVKLRVG